MLNNTEYDTLYISYLHGNLWVDECTFARPVLLGILMLLSFGDAFRHANVPGEVFIDEDKFLDFLFPLLLSEKSNRYLIFMIGLIMSLILF